VKGVFGNLGLILVHQSAAFSKPVIPTRKPASTPAQQRIPNPRSKTTMKNWLRAIVLTAISAAFLTAQPSPPSLADMVANQVAHLTKLLALTTAQAAQATSIFTTEETAISALRTSQQTAQAALKTAVQANSTSGIATAAAQIGALETQAVTARATADGAFYAMLSSAQQMVYNELPQGGGRGFGPPGGGPGGHGRGPGR
jgi:hypothetical protein